eukprot:GILK01005539.1.p1 GENE.GILK01005539.1~~GILK01005539.1.p1  ORF type:complete len:649 (+),score=122.95 GILK01005539.1:53-1999(+)
MDKYQRVKLLGKGSYGKAYLVQCKTDDSLCVVKQMDIGLMSEKDRKDTLKEARVLASMDHPNIITFREVFQSRSREKLFIVMDYADGGDLYQRIKERAGRFFPEPQILDWFVQICLAMKHVHDRKVLHRDLKTQNIFLTSSNMIKLGDFGISRVLEQTKDFARTLVGTPYYLSPEIIEEKPYSFKSDTWSLGIVLYEMATLKHPFDATSLHFLALKIVRGVYPPIPAHYSPQLRNLIDLMLSKDPDRRPSVNEILAMDFITERIEKFLSMTLINVEFSHTMLHNQKCVPDQLITRPASAATTSSPTPSVTPLVSSSSSTSSSGSMSKPRSALQEANARSSASGGGNNNNNDGERDRDRRIAPAARVPSGVTPAAPPRSSAVPKVVAPAPTAAAPRRSTSSSVSAHAAPQPRISSGRTDKPVAVSASGPPASSKSIKSSVVPLPREEPPRRPIAAPRSSPGGIPTPSVGVTPPPAGAGVVSTAAASDAEKQQQLIDERELDAFTAMAQKMRAVLNHDDEPILTPARAESGLTVPDDDTAGPGNHSGYNSPDESEDRRRGNGHDDGFRDAIAQNGGNFSQGVRAYLEKQIGRDKLRRAIDLVKQANNAEEEELDYDRYHAMISNVLTEQEVTDYFVLIENLVLREERDAR